jgi:hypothetical protein
MPPLTRSKTYTNRQSTILTILPPELISHILTFMHPEDYTGFPCTCRLALEIVNATILAQLGFSQNRVERNCTVLATQTGVSVEEIRGKERSETGRYLRMLRECEKEMRHSTSDCYECDDLDEDL